MPAKKAYAPEGEEVKDVVRIAGVELNGYKPIYVELIRIPGVNWRFSHAVCAALGIDKWRYLGSLSDEELEKLEDCLKNPLKYGIPRWMLNRQRDPETGKDLHYVGPDWEIRVKFDIKREIELNTWRGHRHSHGLPVRGQCTKAHHRKGRTIGVLKTRQERKELTKQLQQQ